MCGTNIETTNIALKLGTDLKSDDTNAIILAEPDRNPGDVTRCIKEVEKANLSSNVRVFMQAGGTYIWGHERFRDLNAKIQTGLGKESDNLVGNGNAFFSEWHLKDDIEPGTMISPGKLGRYVYDKNHRNWHPLEQLPITGARNTETDMGSIEGFVSFLKAGQELEKKLYPEGNVRRMLILKNHGGGIFGVCEDQYTRNIISLKEMQDAFNQVKNGWTNFEEKPFEVVAFDACIMSVYETAIAVEDAANYMVASQESTLNKVGFNYTGLLNDLSKNPSMSGKELGKVICNTTWEDSKATDKEFGINSNTVFTESVIDLSKPKMDTLKKAYANFSEETLKVAQKNPDDIVYTFAKFKNAANSSERFPLLDGGTPMMVDLKNFAYNVSVAFPELKEVSNELVKAIDNSVVYNKRGNAFKSGGGLSIYYPFNLINNQEFTYPYQVPENLLSSESPVKLYNYLFKGVSKNLALVDVVDQTGKSVNDPQTGKPYKAWLITEDSILNLSRLSSLVNVKVDDEQNTANIEINRDDLKGVERVRYQLLYIVPRNDDTRKMDMVILGSDSDIEEDRSTGTFKINFNSKKWATINGNNPLYVQVVSDSTRKSKDGKKIGGNDMCMSPILLNGKPYKLFFSRNYPSEKITIIGVVPNEDGKVTLPSGNLESLKNGDIVTPLYFYLKAETLESSQSVKNMTPQEQKSLAEKLSAKGKPIVIGNNPKIEMKALSDGIFGYMFEFVNPIDYRNTIANEGVICQIKNGKIVKVMHSDHFDDVSDLKN